MGKGLFITMEGADGSGKSTQTRFLAEYLQEKGYDVVKTREPGGCKISEQIRDMILDAENSGMFDITEAYLYAAARAQHVAEVIGPAVDAGKIVLCDRFIDSSVAYQGYGRKLGKEKILEINKHAVQFMPDITFFIQIPPERAFLRMNELKVHDRLEQAGIDFHKRTFEGYMKIMKEKSDRVIIIDASGTKFETRDIIRNHMDRILEKRKGKK